MEGREGKGIQPIYRVWGYLESPDPCSAAPKKKEKIEKGIGLQTGKIWKYYTLSNINF